MPPPSDGDDGGAVPATVELNDEASGLTATFVPSAGMLCCSLRDRGEELLAQHEGVAAYAERGKTMGIPLLYPWANRLEAFEYSACGRTVRVPHDPSVVALDTNGLPIHGIVGGRMAWELLVSPHPGRELIASLRWTESEQDLFAVFPFAHEAEYRAWLDGDRLSIVVTIYAHEAVPIAFGFHPYLKLPGVAREAWMIELPTMCRLHLDDRQIPDGGAEPAAARRFELDGEQFDDAFDEVSAGAVLAAQAGERRIGVELLEGYPCAQVFSPPAAQFICFEPMSAPANALVSGSGLEVLAPGCSRRHAFSVEVAASDATRQ